MIAPSTHFRLHYLGSKIFQTYLLMILGIFQQNNIFIDKNVLFPCQHKIREYYPIREKHTDKIAILVMMKIATTFTVRLVYRHGWFCSWSMLTFVLLFFSFFFFYAKCHNLCRGPSGIVNDRYRVRFSRLNLDRHQAGLRVLNTLHFGYRN